MPYCMNSFRHEKPVFLVGMPRSGTKLLRELFNQSDDIYIPQAETDFFGEFDRHFQGRQHALPADLLPLMNRIEQHPYTHFRAFYAPALTLERWQAAVADWTPAGLFEAIIRSESDAASNARIWGDKSPKHIRCLEALDEYFDTPRIVHIVRDARDQAISSARAWGKSTVRAAWRWNEQVNAASDYMCNRKGPGAECRYEDLVADPEGVMRRICAAIDIEFSPRMASPAGTVENLGDTKGVAGVSAANVRKYENLLCAEEVEQLTRLAHSGLQRFGYDIMDIAEGRAPTATERLSGIATDTTRILFQQRHMDR